METALDYDLDKIDDAVLALLWLTAAREKDFELYRAWKGMDWDALDRLHAKGWIHDPKNKNKSVVLTQEGARRSAELFARMFAKG